MVTQIILEYFYICHGFIISGNNHINSMTFDVCGTCNMLLQVKYVNDFMKLH